MTLTFVILGASISAILKLWMNSDLSYKQLRNSSYAGPSVRIFRIIKSKSLGKQIAVWDWGLWVSMNGFLNGTTNTKLPQNYIRRSEERRVGKSQQLTHYVMPSE